MASYRYRDTETGRFVKASVGEHARALGDDSISKELVRKGDDSTQASIDQASFDFGSGGGGGGLDDSEDSGDSLDFDDEDLYP